MKAKFALILAFSFPFTAFADWGNSDVYPYNWTYRKTSLFSVQKLDSASATYSLPYIAPYSLTATWTSAHPAKIYFRLLTDPVMWNPAYDSYLHAYDFFSADPATYTDYYNAYAWRASGSESWSTSYYNQLWVSKTASLSIVQDKLKIDDKYFCLYDNSDSTIWDVSSVNAFGFGVWVNLSDLPGTYWAKYKLWDWMTTVPAQPFTFARYPLTVRHIASAVTDVCPDTYGTDYWNAENKITPFDDPLPDAEDSDAYNKCYSSPFYNAWEKTVDDWGSLAQSDATSSGTTSIWIWQGFLNLFRSNQTNPNTYTDLIFSGSATRFDQIAIERVDYQKIGDPYGWTSPTVIRGKEAIISLRSVSGWVVQPIQWLEIATTGLYASGSYGKAYFYYPDDTLAYVSPVYPQNVWGSPHLVAYNPSVWSKGKTTKVVWRNFNSVVFDSIRPMKWTTSTNRTYCQSNAIKCSWRSYDARNDFFCADTSEFLAVPFGESVTFACKKSNTNVCKPVVFTWSFLGAEWVKLSYVVWGQGAYYVNASGSLEYDPNRRKIWAYTDDANWFECDTSDLAWYEIPWAYWDCTYNKGKKSALEAINNPTKFANDAEKAVWSGATNSKSFRSFFRTTPSVGEWSGSVAVNWANSKSFQDMPSWLGKFFVTSFLIVMGMLVLGMFAMLIFSRRK